MQFFIEVTRSRQSEGKPSPMGRYWNGFFYLFHPAIDSEGQYIMLLVSCLRLIVMYGRSLESSNNLRVTVTLQLWVTLTNSVMSVEGDDIVL